VVALDSRLNAMLISSEQLQAKVNELRHTTVIRKNAPAPPDRRDRHSGGLVTAVEIDPYRFE
jgi:hypothetical protein